MKFIEFLRRVVGCSEEIARLQHRATILAGEREFYFKGYESMGQQLNGLQSKYEALELKYKQAIKEPGTHIDIDLNRVTAGRYTQDKPSHHSPLTRQQMKGVAKNVIVISKELYVVELYGDTNSMEPDIDDNSLIIVHKYHSEDYEIGVEDVVHYIHPNTNTRLLHRVTKIDKRRNDCYYIQGDNNRYADGWATKEQILGIACGQFWGVEPDEESDD